MNVGQILYGLIITALLAFLRLYLFYFHSSTSFVFNESLMLLISAANVFAYWYFAKLVVHFEIEKIKLIADIATVFALIAFLVQLSIMGRFYLIADMYYRLDVIFQIFYIVLFAKILKSQVQHIKWLKIYSGLYISLLGISFLTRVSFGYLYIMGDLLSTISTTGFIITTILLPIVFYVEYKRQDEGDESEPRGDYSASVHKREETLGYKK